MIIFQCSYAQNEYKGYCNCSIKGNKTAITHLKNQVFGDAILKGNEARIKVTNNTSDTLYLFNTYFEEDLADVGVLYRF